MKISEATKLALLDAFMDTGKGENKTYTTTLRESVYAGFSEPDIFEGASWESQNSATRKRWANVREYGCERPGPHDLLFSALGGQRVRHSSSAANRPSAHADTDVVETEQSQWITE